MHANDANRQAARSRAHPPPESPSAPMNSAAPELEQSLIEPPTAAISPLRGRLSMVPRWAMLAYAVLAVGALAARAQPSSYDGAQLVAEQPIGANAIELTIATPAFT